MSAAQNGGKTLESEKPNGNMNVYQCTYMLYVRYAFSQLFPGKESYIFDVIIGDNLSPYGVIYSTKQTILRIQLD
ncbi:hypothetical protein KUTeg_000444 [Tegillarca granosa]|uniref:Uncharacterized protein n=1 Tax=Tegillarca granosa TaxID=220873 RepID=A0ABQ9G1W8_TEGGR|nr:hypothetical protein KUTeg_000444 [Tegillarca granosa]